MPANVTRTENALWERQGADKRTAVRRMFGEVAPTYDLLNSLLSFNLHGKWRAHAVAMLKLQKGDSALDVCCGTGDFFPPLRKSVGESGKVIGLDFCQPMLDRAAMKDARASRLLGDACDLPVASEQFHAVTVGWGLRNVPDIDAAHREIVRVLRPGGRFVSIDMARPSNALMRRVSEFVFSTVAPKLGAMFGKTDAYTYLPQSTQRFWTRDMLSNSMRAAGLTDVQTVDRMLGNICIHYGRKP
jgi:demethylmenaquinone methyltransferase/2-methoxy-6-polyprenyl-1,4-benzoquinol methylase